MKLLKKEMNRREFLKFSLTGLFLLGIASLVPSFVKDKKKNNSEDENNNLKSLGYGKGVYGG